jgi:hypothetical protein
MLKYLKTLLNKVLYCVNIQRLNQDIVKKLYKTVYTN